MAMVVALSTIGSILNDHGFLFLRASPQECELKLQPERQEPPCNKRGKCPAKRPHFQTCDLLPVVPTERQLSQQPNKMNPSSFGCWAKGSKTPCLKNLWTFPIAQFTQATVLPKTWCVLEQNVEKCGNFLYPNCTPNPE
jgi:hypothetical protein